MPRRALVALALALAAVPATARADQSLDPAAGGVNLSAGGGYAVWAEPEEDTGWRLVVRAPDGTVSRPPVGDFSAPPDASVGSSATQDARLLAVYSRERGGSADLYALDLATGKEHRVSPVSTAGADELAPSVEAGRLAFVRRGGRAPGVYVWNGRGAARRLTSTVATQTAINVSRVAYATGDRVLVRKLSGTGAVSTLRATSRPRSLVLSLYRASWLETGGVVAQSERVSVASGARTVRRSTRPLAPATQSIALEGREVTLRLGADGLQRIDPALRFGS